MAIKKPVAKKVATKKPATKKAVKKPITLAQAIKEVDPNCNEFFVIAFDEKRKGYNQLSQGNQLKIFHALDEAHEEIKAEVMQTALKTLINRLTGE